eukprot:scaffold59117_cov28-Tisochrysis_lutea.AAC.4
MAESCISANRSSEYVAIALRRISSRCVGPCVCVSRPRHEMLSLITNGSWDGVAWSSNSCSTSAPTIASLKGSLARHLLGACVLHDVDHFGRDAVLEHGGAVWLVVLRYGGNGETRVLLVIGVGRVEQRLEVLEAWGPV